MVERGFIFSHCMVRHRWLNSRNSVRFVVPRHTLYQCWPTFLSQRNCQQQPRQVWVWKPCRSSYRYGSSSRRKIRTRGRYWDYRRRNCQSSFKTRRWRKYIPFWRLHKFIGKNDMPSDKRTLNIVSPQSCTDNVIIKFHIHNCIIHIIVEQAFTISLLVSLQQCWGIRLQ